MTEWRALLDADTSKEEPNLVDVEHTTNLNPFGDYAVLEITDFDGSRYDEYRKGRRVDVEAKPEGGSFSTQMAGYVVNRRENDEAGANRVSVELYSLDHLLRRGDVREDLADQTLQSALQTVIKDYTPVAWNASNVDIQNPQTITRSFLYERVDDVIGELAALSANEEYGVDQSGDFFFRPRESKKVSRGIDNTNYYEYDVEEKSAELTNVIRTYYDGGDKAVTVSDDQSRSELQSELGTTDPVSFTESKTNQDISKQDDARAFGNVQLEDKGATLQQSITTFGLLDAEPGDTIDATVPAAGLNGEYLIAEITYVWGFPKTTLTLVDVTGNQDNIIKRISDTLKRVEMRPSVAPGDLESDIRALQTGVLAELEVTGDIGGESLLEDSIVVNEGLRQLRDSWGDGTAMNPSTIEVGTDGSIPSRTDTSLGSSSESESVSISTPESDAAEFTNSTNFSTGDDVSEVGVFDGNGNLLIKGRIQGSVTGPDTATVRVTTNDGDDDNSLITNVGQTLTRNIFANNSPDHVDRIAFGSGTTDPTESDTALATNETNRSITNQFVANTSTLFENAESNLSDSDPVSVTPSGSGQKIALQQTADTVEGENMEDVLSFDLQTVSNSDYSGGSGAVLGDDDIYSAAVSIPGGVSESTMAFAIRGQVVSGGTGPVEVRIGLEGIASTTINVDTTLQWYSTTSLNLWFSTHGNSTGQLEIEKVNDSDDDVNIDIAAVYNSDYHTATGFDNNNGGSGGYLDTPANYPSQVVVDLGDETVSAAVTEGEIASTWNDTTNSQYIELNGSQATNSADSTFSFTASKTLTPKAALSRFGSASGTPQTGANGQEVTDFDLAAGLGGASAADINELEVSASVTAGTLDGIDVSELGQKTASGDLATRSTFAPATIGSNQQVEGISKITWINAGRAINTSFYEVEAGSGGNTGITDPSGSEVRVTILRTEVG